ncbi:MAG: hydrogenase [Clostridium sp.]|jgi:nitrogenase molybdenum-iron protein beta chain|uniref:nitrogenase component 1 n=1 Tax=Clostridium sp. TaxID=1506 RepID=UPI0025C72C4D|nr:nitrogenase component 1 [Clostridium sp.]MCH3963700.1 hydrogenase [Clostridium sp.]MCI1714841.1 hydrogenase [Clostridium sp.]MCI1798970.1 hydrogenase [Clostridium sp.]MCI1813024.1 hydrogenase [Clostridium sp.]MCI1869914.1 hydrogenase [Clostridium sp.]
MPKIVQEPRHYCTLGAQQSVIAIKGAMPILHSGPGCGVKLFRGLSTDSGYQGTGYSGGGVIPCTNATEREVVFGGIKRLREVIDGTLKVLKGDLFVVLTGCTSDIVGDDVGSLVDEYKKKGIPIVFAETGGFKGSNFKGHEVVLKAIIDQFVGDKKPEVRKGLVNVFSSIPFQDTFWGGNLGSIKHLLEKIGLEVNILFGPESGGVDEWKTIPDAEFNIVLSPWVGVETAELLKAKYGTPYLHYAIPPIGARETSSFLRSVADFAGLDKESVEKVIKTEEDIFYYYLERSADFFLEFRYSIPDRFFNITDSFYALGISQFLLNELGIVPGEQYITDDTPIKYQDYIRDEFKKISDTRDFKIFFEMDGEKINERLRRYDLGTHIPLILGSSWDRDIAEELKAFRINISIPVMHRLVLNGGYLGYSGGLRLIEDIYGNILETYK